jgi:putative peptidoglycan lipid II flippase
MSAAVRHILFWSIPAIVLFIVLRAQIVRVILGSGAFSWEDTRLTAAALALFVLSLAAQGLNVLFIRAYYAAGRTMIPSVITLFGTGVTLILAYCFTYVFNTFPLFARTIEVLLRIENIRGSSIVMLPLAYAVGTVLMLLIFAYTFRRDFGQLAPTLRVVVTRTFGASVIGGFAAYLTLVAVLPFVDTDTFIGIFAQGLVAGIVGLSMTTYMLYLQGSEELKETVYSFSQRFLRPSEVTPGQDIDEHLS